MFTLSMGAYREQGAMVLTRGGARPVAGVYRVSSSWSQSPTDFHGLVVTGSPNRPTGVFHAESGSVTILASTADRIAGTFELHGAGFLASFAGGRESRTGRYRMVQRDRGRHHPDPDSEVRAMSIKSRIKSLYQWYRALRSLQRIMATMG